MSRATELARAPELPNDKFTELRNAVTASLALPDLYLNGPSVTFPADGYGYDFDEAHAIYARTDRRGDCSVRHVADDVELHHLSGLGLEAWPYFSRDGKFLAIVHIRNERPGRTGAAAHLWDLRQPTARRIRSEENAHVVDFHPNGRQVALAYNDGTICVFQLPSGEPVGRPLAPDTLTREVMVSLHPTEPLVAVCSYFESVVEVRDLQTGNVVASMPQYDRPTHALWNPDGQTLAVGYGTASPIRLYDRTTLQPYRTLQGVQWGMYLTFNHAGDRLAAYGWGSRVELFDVGTGQRLFTTAGGTRRFSIDDHRLAGGLQDGKLGIWSVGDGRECRTLVRQALPPGTGYYTSVALHPDGRLLAAGMEDGFGLWDLESGSELRFVPIDGGDSGVRDLCFERSGALLTAGLSGMFRWPVHAVPDSAGRITVGPPQHCCLGPNQ